MKGVKLQQQLFLLIKRRHLIDLTGNIYSPYWRSLGFGPTFIAWIRLLYHNIVSHVIVNNLLIAKIPLTRSMPRLPIVTTALRAEYRTIGLSFSCNVRIEGIHVPDTMHSVKVSAYADNTTCFVSNN